MDKLKDYSGSVFGGLAKLLFDFCTQKNIEIPNKLKSIQNVERFPYATWYDLLTELDDQLKIPALGLEIAKYIQPKHLGVLAYIAISCKNLTQALERLQDLYRLIYDGSPLIIENQLNHLSIRWDNIPTTITTQVTDEISIALMIQFFRFFMSNQESIIHEIHFFHPQPKNKIIYEQYFSCPIKFSQSCTQILIPLNALQFNLNNNDQILQNILLKQAHKELSKLPESTRFDSIIHKAIVNGLNNNEFQITHLSEQLRVSVRQLQRYFKQNNTTYQNVLQQIRCDLAKQYLENIDLDLNEIAQLLGYSEQSSFQRAFKQWTQMSPQKWRKVKQNCQNN